MKTDLFNTIIKSSIPVLDNGTIISYAFIFEFTIPNEPDKVVPFLIMNYNDLEKTQLAVLKFDSIQGDKKDKYCVSFDKKIIEEFHVNDYIIYPIATFLNTCISKGIKIDYFGFRNDFILNIDNPNTRGVENLSYFTYLKNSLGEFPIVNATHNLTPFYGGNGKSFFIESSHDLVCGFPVLIADEGSFNNGNGVCLGNRVLLAGVAIKKVDGLVEVQYAKSVIEAVKFRFSNLLPKNEQ